MIVLDGYQQVRKFKLLLEAMATMRKAGKEKDEIIAIMLKYEKELKDLMLRNNDYLYYTFRHQEKQWDLKNNKPMGYNGTEILDCGYRASALISPFEVILNTLAMDKKFDMDDISDAISLVNKLVEFNVDYVCIGSDVISSDLYVSKCIDLDPKYKDEDRTYYVKKVFSDSPIVYDKKNKAKGNYGEKNYKCQFTKNPTWVLYGQVFYDENKKLYLGSSSPISFYNFYGESLTNIDVRNFPTFEELYKLKKCPSLVLTKKKAK